MKIPNCVWVRMRSTTQINSKQNKTIRLNHYIISLIIMLLFSLICIFAFHTALNGSFHMTYHSIAYIATYSHRLSCCCCRCLIFVFAMRLYLIRKRDKHQQHTRPGMLNKPKRATIANQINRMSIILRVLLFHVTDFQAYR